MIAETTHIAATEDPSVKKRHLAVEPTIEEEIITPEDAKIMLRNVVPEKELRYKPRKDYIDALRKGDWSANGTRIAFDYYGRVMDGVQRLQACVDANVPLRTLVVRNLTPGALFTMDTHKQRTHVTVLESLGYAHASLLAPAVGKLYRIENGKYGASLPLAMDELEVMLEANPLLEEAADIAVEHHSYILSSPVLVILTFQALTAGHRDELKEFLDRYEAFDETGAIPAEGSNAPEVLKGKIEGWYADSVKQVGNKKRLVKAVSSDVVMGTVIKFFNAFLKGERVSQRLSFVPIEASKDDDGPAVKNMGLPTVLDYPGLQKAKLGEAAEVMSTNQKRRIAANKKAEKKGQRVIAAFYDITPDMARDFLAKFNRGNRTLMELHYRMIQRDIENDRWMQNADPICFTSDPFNYDEDNPPRLLNGQHRLNAIALSGKTLRIPIAWNISETAFATYDNHRKAQALTRKEETKADTRVLMAAARFVWKTEQGKKPWDPIGQTPSNMELLDVIERNPKLKTYAALARTKHMRQFGSAGVIAYFLHRIYNEDPEAAEVMSNYMQAKEVPLEYTSGERNPLTVFAREATISPTAGSRGKSRKDVLSALVNHWGAFRDFYHKKRDELYGGGKKEKQENLF